MIEYLTITALTSFGSPFLLQADAGHAYIVQWVPGWVNLWSSAQLVAPCPEVTDFSPFCDDPIGLGLLRPCFGLSCVEVGRWQARAFLSSLPALIPSVGRPGLTLRIDAYDSTTEWRRPPIFGVNQVTWDYAVAGTHHTHETGAGELGLAVAALAAWESLDEPTVLTTTVRLRGLVQEGEVVIAHDFSQHRGTITISDTEVGTVIEDPERIEVFTFRFTACE